MRTTTEAGSITLALAIAVAIFAFQMPVDMAFAAAGYGFAYGLWPIAWIIVAAVFLYKLTVKSGQFEVIRSSVLSITDDQRLQVLLIGFAFGAFLVSQQAVKRMLPGNHGAVLLSGATAGVKGFALSATFAMGKLALRGLAQSMARELSPKGIHVAHFVIDGGIRSAARPVPADAPDSLLDPDAIAETYWATLQQHRSAWSWEVEVRPWVEKF